MSKTDSLHYTLCIEGGKWLKRNKRSYDRCKKKSCYKPEFCKVCSKNKIVAIELVTMAAENCDIWGYDGFNTTVIEVKVSHPDFLRDREKPARKIDVEYQCGNLRWYLCPDGIIKPSELPEGWGLLYWDGKKINPIVPPVKRTGTMGDMRILYSIMFREGLCDKIYNYRGTPSTIKPKTIDGIPESQYYKQQMNLLEGNE